MLIHLARYTKSSLPTPKSLGREFSLPFIVSVAVGVALIALLYADLAPAIWQFLTESATALLPLATSLFEIWIAYAALFAIVVYSNWRESGITWHELGAIARVVCEATTPAIRAAVRCLVQGRYTHIRLIPRLTDRLRNLIHPGLPNHLALGFQSGTHPKLE